MIFTGKKISREVKDCLEGFQQTVHKEAGNHHLQFATGKWTTEENAPTPANEERFQIVMNDEFPFLDMKISWSPEEDLKFSVFRGKGQ